MAAEAEAEAGAEAAEDDDDDDAIDAAEVWIVRDGTDIDDNSHVASRFDFACCISSAIVVRRVADSRRRVDSSIVAAISVVRSFGRVGYQITIAYIIAINVLL